MYRPPTYAMTFLLTDARRALLSLFSSVFESLTFTGFTLSLSDHFVDEYERSVCDV